MKSQGYHETWVCYLSDAFSAKELTVFPGQSVTIKDSAAYGIIVMNVMWKRSHVIKEFGIHRP